MRIARQFWSGARVKHAMPVLFDEALAAHETKSGRGYRLKVVGTSAARTRASSTPMARARPAIGNSLSSLQRG
jgi:hypothetical protein